MQDQMELARCCRHQFNPETAASPRRITDALLGGIGAALDGCAWNAPLPPCGPCGQLDALARRMNSSGEGALVTAGGGTTDDLRRAAGAFVAGVGDDDNALRGVSTAKAAVGRTRGVGDDDRRGLRGGSMGGERVWVGVGDTDDARGGVV